MKKTLSLILALCLLLSLGSLMACGKEAATEPPVSGAEAPAAETPAPAPATSPASAEPAGDGSTTETVTIGTGATVEAVTAADGTITYNGLTVDELNAAQPCEHIQEKLAAGLEPLIASSFVSLKSDFMVNINAGMEAAFLAAGFAYASATSEETINLQLEHMENYVTMGASILCVFPNDSDMVGTAAQDAMARGTWVVVNGRVDPSYGVTLVSQQNHAELGEKMGDMVLDWIDKQYGADYAGVVKGAVFYNLNIPDFKTRYESFMPMFEADPRVEIVYENHGPVMGADAAFTATEEALTFDSEIRFVVCTTSSGALGVSNYIISQTFDNLDEFAAFGTDSTDMALDMVDEATAGGNSVLRGVVFTGTFTPSDCMTVPIFNLVNGMYEIPGAQYSDPVTTYNSFGFEVQ